MELTPEKISELSALATILFIVLIAVWRGVPQLIAYLERKDMSHREDIMNLIAENRAERDILYERLGASLDRVHDRLDTIETAVRTTKPGITNG